jgi:hypothetical protein
MTTSLPPVSRLTRRCGILNLWQPYRHPEPVMGIDSLFTLILLCCRNLSESKLPMIRDARFTRWIWRLQIGLFCSTRPECWEIGDYSKCVTVGRKINFIVILPLGLLLWRFTNVSLLSDFRLSPRPEKAWNFGVYATSLNESEWLEATATRGTGSLSMILYPSGPGSRPGQVKDGICGVQTAQGADLSEYFGFLVNHLFH